MRLGFGRGGFKRHLAAGPPLTPRALSGATLITGATAGIGRATAEALAPLGTRPLVWGRSTERGTEVATATGGTFQAVDLGDLDAVAAAAAQVDGPLDAVVLNAGAMPLDRQLTPQGHELVWGSQVLGHLLLLRQLHRRGLLSPTTRVVWVSSGGMYLQRLSLDDLRRDHGYQRHAVYANAKRAQIVLQEELAKRWPAVWSAAMHPGWADTSGVQQSMPWFRRLTQAILRGASQGADTIVWLVAHDEVGPSGRFWFDREQTATESVPGTATSASMRQALVDHAFGATEPFVGVRHPESLASAAPTRAHSEVTP